MGALPFIHVQTLKNMLPKQLDSLEQAYGNVIEAPEDPAKWPQFRKELHAWRESALKAHNYTGAAYQDEAFQWANSNYTCCFLIMYDLEFYDPVKGIYTVDRILKRGEQEFGGYDSVVLWHAYPKIGVDERNQYDFYRDMPGGLAGVKQVVKEFHDHGVHVFINYNPWDISTRRESKPDIDALAEVIAAIDADGIFLDTMKEAGSGFREKLDQIRPGIVLEGELAAELEILPTHHLSWAQWFGDKYVPGILRNKWYERKHMQHQIARLNRDHSAELHQAWMNGSGMMIWENVFGQWIAWSDRDKSILRTMLPIQRRYHQLFIGEGWTPLVNTLADGVFASLWEGNGMRLWTLVNRHEREVSAELLKVISSPEEEFYDLIAGEAATIVKDGDAIKLKGTISARSIACFIAGKKDLLGKDFKDFLGTMRKIKSGYRNDPNFSKMSPVLKGVKPTLLTGSENIDGMKEIHPMTVSQTTEFIIRESGAYSSYPEISLGQLGKPLIFQDMRHIPHIAIDETPVTNKQYFEFIKASGYSAKEKHNFLKHWQNGMPPKGKDNHPVVYIDLDDARAYAAWAGKRLPKESEWQFAAQGYDYLKYPWGNDLKEGCYNNSNGTTAVDAFPAGRSPFGCLDMCGNTWELTESEYADAHNRFCILKGGSYYDPKGSSWYVPGGPQPSTRATKFLLMYPGLDRCATIGFRCIKDLR